MSAVSERSRGPVVVALARTEGWKLITHPVFLVGVGIALVGCASFVQAIATQPAVTWGEDGWTAAVGVMLLGVMTMVATNLAALRDRRAHTQEQHAALPMRPPARTSSLLAATLWPAAVATVILGAIVGFAAIKEIGLNDAETVHLVELVVALLLFGSIGIALAAWAPSPFVAPVLAWALLFVTPGETPASWHSLLPWATLGSTELALWHLAYLAGLTGIVAVIALAKTSRPRTLVVPALVAVAVVVASAVVMLDGACPAVGPCLL